MSTRNLDNVVLFHVAVSLWTGQKKLDQKDIDNDLPKDLGSLGHKKTVDPKTLSPMATVKKAMEIILSNTGIRFMGNFYAVPTNRLKEVSSLLDQKVAEGNAIRQDFLANYLSNVEDWISRHPDWESRIRPVVVPLPKVAAAINFGYDVFTINAVAGHSDSVENHSAKMGSQLLQEISEEINELYERSVLGKDSVNRRIRMPFERLRSKMFGFSFVDPIVLPLVKLIDETLKLFPDDGPITGNELSKLVACMMVLSDEDKMREYGARVSSGNTADEDEDEDQDDVAPLPIQAPVQAVLIDPEPAVPAVAPAVPTVAASAAPVVAAPAVPTVAAPAAPVVAASVAPAVAAPLPVSGRRKMKVAA